MTAANTSLPQQSALSRERTGASWAMAAERFSLTFIGAPGRKWRKKGDAMITTFSRQGRTDEALRYRGDSGGWNRPRSGAGGLQGARRRRRSARRLPAALQVLSVELRVVPEAREDDAR